MTALTEGKAMNIAKPLGAILVAATLLIALVGTSAAFAEDRPTLDCTIRFQLSGWSAIYERVDGTGIVACSDDTSLAVAIQAPAAGFTVGKPKITHGTGKFARVRQIGDVFGTYSLGDMQPVVVKAGDGELLTNGKVSLGLAGAGEGSGRGTGMSGFTIRPQ